MNHKKITYKNFTTEGVILWSLLLEYYNPTIKYIKGYYNGALGVFIRIPLIDSDVMERYITRETLSELYSVDKMYCGRFPLKY